MDRQTRKANFKKLQQPTSTKLRSTRSKTTATSTLTLSNYFDTPEEISAEQPPIHHTTKTDCKENEHLTDEPRVKKPRESDDFEKEVAKPKQAPKLKRNTSKPRRGRSKQPSISAFLRNEQLFSEVTAQHCMADNFSPDDIEMALALSKSEAEKNGRLHLNEADDEVVNLLDENNDHTNENIRLKLQKYGFRTAAKEDYNTLSTAIMPVGKRGKKCKWANKFTPLTLRNADWQQQKLHKNVAAILDQQVKTKKLNAEQLLMTPYELISKRLSRLRASNENRITHEPSEEPILNPAAYYVPDLFEVSKTRADHLLKSWSAIQGRDLSPERQTKQCRAELQRLQQAFAELEAFFDAKPSADYIVPELKIEGKPVAPDEQQTKELDELEQLLIENMIHDDSTACDMPIPVSAACSSPTIEPPDKRAKLSDIQVSNANAQSNLSLPTQATRSTSPDIFANSDEEADEMPMTANADAEIANLSTKVYKDNSLVEKETAVNITSYEIYSSDEVKTVTDTTPKNKLNNDIFEDSIIDLTEDISPQYAPHDNATKTNKVDECLDKHHFNASPTFVGTFDHSPPAKHAYSMDSISCNRHSVLSSSPSKLNAYGNNLASPEPDNNALSFTLASSTNSFDKPSLFDEPPVRTSGLSFDLNTSTKNQDRDLFKSSPTLERNKMVAALDHSPPAKHAHSLDSVSFKRHSVLLSSPSKLNAYGNNLAPQEPDNNALNFTLASSTNSFDNPSLFDDPPVRASGLSFDLNTSTKFKKSSSYTQSPIACNQFQLDYSYKSPLFERKSNSFSTQAASRHGSPLLHSDISIDLTQDSSDEAKEENDGVLLSDDEINYSIWKANKTLNAKSNVNVVDDASISSDSSFLYDEALLNSQRPAVTPFKSVEDFDAYLKASTKKIDISKNLPTPHRSRSPSPHFKSVAKLTDFLNVADDASISSDSSFLYDEALLKSQRPAVTPFKSVEDLDAYLKASTSKVDISHNSPTPQRSRLPHFKNIAESNDFLKTTTVKLADSDASSSRSPNKSALSKSRAEFGILDAALSQPFTLSQLESPAKQEKINWAEASFLDTAVEAPLKRLSTSNADKFNELLANIMEPAAAEPDDFDEFDRLVFQNSRHSADNVKSVPSGLDRLLNGDINMEPLPQPATPVKQHLQQPATPVKQPSIDASAVPEQLEVQGNLYNIRVCDTPKPDFTKLSEAEILKQLYNYGLKPLKRKHAVKMLEFIYNQTHPIMLEAQEPPIQPSCSIASLPRSKSTPVSGSNNKGAHNKLQQLNSIDCLAPTVAQPNSKLQFRDAFGDELLRFSQVQPPALCDDFEYYVLQTNVTKKTPQPLVPLHIAWHNLLCANPELHQSMLMYEPIDLQEVYLYLKQLGHRFEPKDLKSFFDRRCIIFRYELAPPQKHVQRHVRKKPRKANAKF